MTSHDTVAQRSPSPSVSAHRQTHAAMCNTPARMHVCSLSRAAHTHTRTYAPSRISQMSNPKLEDRATQKSSSPPVSTRTHTPLCAPPQYARMYASFLPHAHTHASSRVSTMCTTPEHARMHPLASLHARTHAFLLWHVSLSISPDLSCTLHRFTLVVMMLALLTRTQSFTRNLSMFLASLA